MTEHRSSRGILSQEYACAVAKWVLDMLEEGGFPITPGDLEAIVVKRRWLAGEATDGELADAWTSRRSLIGIAAWYGALEAARAASETEIRAALKNYQEEN